MLPSRLLPKTFSCHPCAIRTNGPHGDSMAESKFEGAVKEGQRDQGFDKSRGTPTDAGDLAYS